MREVIKVVFWDYNNLNMDQIYQHLIDEYRPKKLIPFFGGYEVSKETDTYRYTCLVIFVNEDKK